MDILTTNMTNGIVTSFKIIFVIAGCIVALVNFFQIKEATNMERKMSIPLPTGVHFGMTLQFLLSVVFVFASTIYFFVF